MEILGIGPLELLFVLILMLIVMGPQDMVKAGAALGRTLRKLMTSPTWKLVQDTSRQIRYLPNRLARQAGIEEMQKELKQVGDLPKISDLQEQVGEEFNLEAWTQPVGGNTNPMADEPSAAQEPETPETTNQEQT